jgi:hypothetical protein
MDHFIWVNLAGDATNIRSAANTSAPIDFL